VDLSGRLIMQGHEVLDGIAPLQIGVASLEPGMYHLQVNDGRFSRTLRFIKH